MCVCVCSGGYIIQSSISVSLDALVSGSYTAYSGLCSVSVLDATVPQLYRANDERKRVQGISRGNIEWLVLSEHRKSFNANVLKFPMRGTVCRYKKARRNNVLSFSCWSAVVKYKIVSLYA